jgi:acyl-CoA synthetase (AMP-forming)/AMP-acid ligase II
MTGETLDNILRRQARERGDRIALRCGDETVTYAELDLRACRIANGLRAAGVMPGDRVCWLGKNSLSYFQYLAGSVKAGAVMVPVNWRLAPPEVAYIVGDARAKFLIAEPEFESTARAAGGPEPLLAAVGGAPSPFSAWRDAQSGTDPQVHHEWTGGVLQMYTSGTTGRPKGAVLTHRSLFGLRAAMKPAETPAWYPWHATDVSLIAMPVAHVSGTCWGIWTLQHGATGVITREFDPHAVLGLLVEHRINRLMMVPTALQIAVRHPKARETDFSFLKYICYGGAPMPVALLSECMEVFGCGFVQMYGMTETSGTIVALEPQDHDPSRPELLRSVGRALPGVELRIVDDAGRPLPPGETGEISTRSLCNMAHYFNRPEATAETIDADGWLRTGDAGYLDAQGYLFLRDRVKDMIITGGENVYPAEVENAIFGHPDVAEVAVIGVPDPKWGEAVKAVVVPKPGAPEDAASIIAWARERIAAYKAPKSVDFVAALPRNATGKVLRRELRARHRQG